MAIYGTLAAADAYHLARGNAAWTGTDEAKGAALQRATDYIDGRYRYMTAGGCWVSAFRGSKTGGRSQDLEWPRTGATDSEGNEIPDDEVPIEVEHATYEAALIELTSSGSLSPIFIAAQQVTREKVGPVEVAYSESKVYGGMPPNRPTVPLIDDLLAFLVCFRPPFGVGVRVV
jgi:hypothetical protein